LPSCLPFGKAGGLQILRFQGFAVVHYSVTLSALSLKPSDFCNVRDNINYLGQILSDIGNLKLMEQDKFEGADINTKSRHFELNGFVGRD